MHVSISLPPTVTDESRHSTRTTAHQYLIEVSFFQQTRSGAMGVTLQTQCINYGSRARSTSIYNNTQASIPKRTMCQRYRTRFRCRHRSEPMISKCAYSEDVPIPVECQQAKTRRSKKYYCDDLCEACATSDTNKETEPKIDCDASGQQLNPEQSLSFEENTVVIEHKDARKADPSLGERCVSHSATKCILM